MFLQSKSKKITFSIFIGFLLFITATVLSVFFNPFNIGFPLVFQKVIFDSPDRPQPSMNVGFFILDILFWMCMGFVLVKAIVDAKRPAQSE